MLYRHFYVYLIVVYMYIKLKCAPIVINNNIAMDLEPLYYWVDISCTVERVLGCTFGTFVTKEVRQVKRAHLGNFFLYMHVCIYVMAL